MTGTTLHIPTLQTERLTLRAYQVSDFASFSAFLSSDRAQYVGGPYPDPKMHARSWGNGAGQWVLRGYGSFVLCLSDGTPIGAAGPWNPIGWPEPEFGWTLWSAKHEGKGYITEAMRMLIPWSWDKIGTDTAASYIDAPNAASIAVAKRLGAEFDPVETQKLNQPGSIMHQPDGPDVHVYRHHKGRLS